MKGESDEAKSVTLLGGHLSPNSYLFDLNRSFCPFRYFGKKSGKKELFWMFLEHKSEENGKVSKSPSWNSA